MIGVDIVENVLERLGTTESTTLALAREAGGKIRVTSLLWPEPKVILKDEVLEVRKGRRPACTSPQQRYSDEGDPPVEAYDPYGACDEFIDD